MNDEEKDDLAPSAGIANGILITLTVIISVIVLVLLLGE